MKYLWSAYTNQLTLLSISLCACFLFQFHF